MKTNKSNVMHEQFVYIEKMFVRYTIRDYYNWLIELNRILTKNHYICACILI